MIVLNKTKLSFFWCFKSSKDIRKTHSFLEISFKNSLQSIFRHSQNVFSFHFSYHQFFKILYPARLKLCHTRQFFPLEVNPNLIVFYSILWMGDINYSRRLILSQRLNDHLFWFQVNIFGHQGVFWSNSNFLFRCESCYLRKTFLV